MEMRRNQLLSPPTDEAGYTTFTRRGPCHHIRAVTREDKQWSSPPAGSKHRNRLFLDVAEEYGIKIETVSEA